MKAQLEAIEKKAFEELTAAQDLKDLDAVRAVSYTHLTLPTT